jgi:soluble lytic murein transglycosylase-like protein
MRSRHRLVQVSAVVALACGVLSGPALVLVGGPSGAAQLAAAKKKASPAPIVLRLSYRVQPGDAPASIARRYGVATAQLLKVNKLRATAVLRPGRVLRIPNLVVPGKLAAKLPRPLAGRPDRLRFVTLFQTAAKEFRVPTDLLMALAYRESNWNPTARSRSGAMGVGQLMPTTVTFVSERLLRSPRPLDPWEPADNIRMSARTLRYLLDLNKGDVTRTLASYYQGYGSVTRQGVLPIGQRYANSIVALRPQFST